MEWDGNDRRQQLRLSDDEINRIFDVGEKRFEQFLGKSSLRLLLRLLGALCAAGIGYALAQAEKWFK